MPDTNDSLIPPLDIPWKLASSSQPPSVEETGEPFLTALALFYYEPKISDLPNIETDYPDERLVYIKVIATFEPLQGNSVLNVGPSHIFNTDTPILYAQLNVRVRSEKPDVKNAFSPYFHAAAPLRRHMVETGVIGDDAYENEGKGIVMGKSGSQLHETVNSFVATDTKTKDVNLGIIGGGNTSSRTGAFSERNAEQYTESMQRQASQERAELLSHTSNVENVLTLLTGKYVGTPHLVFSMHPRPLRMLSVDPADPNTWYGEMLRRRSSGIEGIQEFFAIVVVPRKTPFCIEAKLRQTYIPAMPSYPPNLAALQATDIELSDYLNAKYPPGTPLEELDIDVEDLVPKQAHRPVIKNWVILNRRVVMAYWHSWLMGDLFFYKMRTEVALEMHRQRYLDSLTESPLEQGFALALGVDLEACFPGDEKLQVKNASASGIAGHIIEFEPDSSRPRNLEINGGGLRTTFTSVVNRWNTLQRQLARTLEEPEIWSDQPLDLGHPRLTRWLLERAKRLAPDDPRNIPLKEASELFKFDEKTCRLLESANIRDIRELANAVTTVPQIEKYNEHMKELEKQIKQSILERKVSGEVKPKESATRSFICKLFQFFQQCRPVTSVEVVQLGENWDISQVTASISFTEADEIKQQVADAMRSWKLSTQNKSKND